MAEAGQLTVNAPVTPSWVLRGHAQDEGLDRGCGGWAAGTAMPTVVPLPRDEFAVPGQQGGRRDREDLLPLGAGYQVRERRKPQAVGWFVPHAWDLVAQDRVLMPKHQQFRLLGCVAP